MRWTWQKFCRKRNFPRTCFLRTARSEEHTSELQSQSNLVCRLLLEKKKKEREDVGQCLSRVPPLALHRVYHRVLGPLGDQPGSSGMRSADHARRRVVCVERRYDVLQ